MFQTRRLQQECGPCHRSCCRGWRITRGIMVLAGVAATTLLESVAEATLWPTQSVPNTLNASFTGAPPAYVGPIDDAHCQMEDLENANDSQLYTILHELTATPYFRTFVVDLERPCPLKSFASGSGDAHEHDDEEEFVCAASTTDELDVDSPPLCTVDTTSSPNDKSNFNPFAAAFDSNALQSLSQGGFESYDQKATFGWEHHVDKVVETPPALGSPRSTTDCDNDPLSELFWMDLCRHLQDDDDDMLTSRDGKKNVVNLALNPERNTGYNGTHIWRAIYEENCILLDNDDSAMCLEERVLYRLLSGLHTSTTLHIAKHYYPPSKRKGRVDWEANAQFFMDKFQHQPDHVRNLHFSYVVLLRALSKAAPVLYNVDLEDGTARVLLRRLLDSAILQSCSSVFTAFDEGIMFQGNTAESSVSLQQNFKGVFHNVSSILDCVQCQQCKLHGKMAMLGYGTALKILFVKPELLELERNEIVALLNTLAKLSQSMRLVRELTQLYWQQHSQRLQQQQGGELLAGTAGNGGAAATTADTFLANVELVDAAVGAVAALGREHRIPLEREQELVHLALQRNVDLLILTKHYGLDTARFATMVTAIGSGAAVAVNNEPDAIVIGSGLAGLVAALNILDRGGRVVILEKEHTLGGNSAKASSGMNAWAATETHVINDTLDVFRNDTIRSAGTSARPDLIDVLVSKSGEALEFLRTRVGVDLSLKAQLGGHSVQRTHRPSNGMVGAEIIFAMQRAVKAYSKSSRVQILTDSKVTKLLTDSDSGAVVGVEYVKGGHGDDLIRLHAPNTILATGGFAADRTSGSLLAQYRPELVKMPTTAGAWSTGDGVGLATALGAGLVDMDHVQVHPTGWVDPADPHSTSKTLAAELMRGVGGILLNNAGERFCNELGTRAYVTDTMLSHNARYAKTGQWDVQADIPTFSMVLSAAAADDGKKHVALYMHKGLMTKLEGVGELAKWMGLPKRTVVATLQEYQKDAASGQDVYGKTTFRGVFATDLEKEIFYAGTVTPVLHYCMGGVTIDKQGNVLREDGTTIPNLHAAGEVSGGVHGVNRLAGNSLLECTVFGTIVGQKIPVQQSLSGPAASASSATVSTTSTASRQRLQTIDPTELGRHNTPDDCWVAIHGMVYDLTDFADEHPAGAHSIHVLAGTDGTAAFAAVHNENLMDDFDDVRMGVLLKMPSDDETEEECEQCNVVGGAEAIFS